MADGDEVHPLDVPHDPHADRRMHSRALLPFLTGSGGRIIRLGREAYESARRAGIEAVHGVANANSTRGVTRRLGMTPMGSLPVSGGVVAVRDGELIDELWLGGKGFAVKPGGSGVELAARELAQSG